MSHDVYMTMRREELYWLLRNSFGGYVDDLRGSHAWFWSQQWVSGAALSIRGRTVRNTSYLHMSVLGKAR